MTKKEQKDAAWKAYKTIEAAVKAYRAIKELAYEVYRAELARIDSEPDEKIIEVDGKHYQLIK